MELSFSFLGVFSGFQPLVFLGGCNPGHGGDPWSKPTNGVNKNNDNLGLITYNNLRLLYKNLNKLCQ